MLTLLKRLQRRSEISRLRDRCRGDTSPKSFGELCRLFVGIGDTQSALRTAQEGLARFPHSEDLRDFLRHTMRVTRAPEFDALRAQCESATDPKPFHELARLSIDSEEFDEALAVAETMSQRFPSYDGAWILQAEILLMRFFRDHVAGDATRGIAQLKRVIEINEKSFEAHLLLTKIYHYIGAISKALFHLYKALDVRPDDKDARRIYESLIALPLERDEESSLLREIEEEGIAPNQRSSAANGESAEAAPERRSALLSGINRLSHLNGVRRAALVSSELVVVAERGECRVVAPGETDPLCEMAKNFRKAASVSSKRMGIGSFQTATLSAGDCFLRFHAVNTAVVMVEAERSVAVELIQTECANFVASCFSTASADTSSMPVLTKEPINA